MNKKEVHGINTDKKAIMIYLLLTFALSTICYYIRIAGGDAANNITALLMWCPGISAFIIQRIFYPNQKILGFRKTNLFYILSALIIPACYLGFSYGLYWLLEKNALKGQLLTDSTPFLLVLLLSSFATALGEEIGWRGFLQPKMCEVWGLKSGIVFSSIIWALWHFPLLIGGNYQAATPIWFRLPMFTIEIVAISVIFSILRMKSRSIWPAAVLHASHNFFDQVVFAPLTNNSKSAFYVGETGILTILFAIVFIIILIKAGKKQNLENNKFSLK